MKTLNGMKIIAISAVASLILVGCGSSTSSEAPVSGVTISGTAIDPEIQGANIYLDANENGKFDVGELNTTSDKYGKYSLIIQSADVGKPIIAEGGIDRVTKEDFRGKLIMTSRAIEGEQFITPLTTLVRKSQENAPDKSLEEIRSELATKLGLASTDDLDKDILTDNDLLKIALRINTVAQNVSDSSGKEVDDVYKNIAKRLSETDFDQALEDAIGDDVNKTSLDYAKLLDLTKELKNLDHASLDSDQLALTVDNIDRNITATRSRVELDDDLFDDDNIIISSAAEVRELKDERVLEKLGFKDLDDAIKTKLKENKDLDFDDDLISDIKDKIEQNRIGLDAKGIQGIDREKLFNESSVKDLSDDDKKKFKDRFENEGLDFSKTTKEDFEKKLKEAKSLVGLPDDVVKQIENKISTIVETPDAEDATTTTEPEDDNSSKTTTP